jgi:hypothetical protein
MKKVFYGAAIQGAVDKKDRSRIHHFIIEAIKNIGCNVISEHTAGSQEDYERKRREPCLSINIR